MFLQLVFYMALMYMIHLAGFRGIVIFEAAIMLFYIYQTWYYNNCIGNPTCRVGLASLRKIVKYVYWAIIAANIGILLYIR